MLHSTGHRRVDERSELHTRVACQKQGGNDEQASDQFDTRASEFCVLHGRVPPIGKSREHVRAEFIRDPNAHRVRVWLTAFSYSCGWQMK